MNLIPKEHVLEELESLGFAVEVVDDVALLRTPNGVEVGAVYFDEKQHLYTTNMSEGSTPFYTLKELRELLAKRALGVLTSQAQDTSTMPKGAHRLLCEAVADLEAVKTIQGSSQDGYTVECREYGRRHTMMIQTANVSFQGEPVFDVQKTRLGFSAKLRGASAKYSLILNLLRKNSIDPYDRYETIRFIRQNAPELETLFSVPSTKWKDFISDVSNYM